MKCDCKYWKENAPIIDSALVLAGGHGFKTLKKSFNYCPYCSKDIRDPKPVRRNLNQSSKDE